MLETERTQEVILHRPTTWFVSILLAPLIGMISFILGLVQTVMGRYSRSNDDSKPTVTAKDKLISTNTNNKGLTVYFGRCGLFPGFGNLRNLSTDDLKQCALDADSNIVPYRDARGEIGFKFSHQRQPQRQQPSPISDISSPEMKSKRNGFNAGQRMLVTQKSGMGLGLLSPASSVRSSISSDKGELNDKKMDIKAEVKQAEELMGESEIETSEGEKDDEGQKTHTCPYCHARFRLRGYLTRHMKKHSKKKAYRCPFYDPNSPQKCHATGGFSRRDTYKTHLKARHFRYPPGVKSGQRTGMVGWCAACGEKFLNNEIWVERHIEAGLCPGLPAGYMKTMGLSKKRKTGKHSKLLDAVPDAKFYSEEDYLPPTMTSPMTSVRSGSTSPSSGGFSQQTTTNTNTTTGSSTSTTGTPSPSFAAALWEKRCLEEKQRAQQQQQELLASYVQFDPLHQKLQMLYQQNNNFRKQQQQQQNEESLKQIETQLMANTSAVNSDEYSRSSSSLPISTMDSKSSEESESGITAEQEEDFPSLDAECSPYTYISYPPYYYKNVNDEREQNGRNPHEVEIRRGSNFSYE